jgi:superoxide dismutase, Fe-Mn family
MSIDRRNFLHTTALAGGAAMVSGAFTGAIAQKTATPTEGELTKHELPKLSYGYDALEPHIDAKTLEIHHSKHHQGYVTGLNEAEQMLAEARAKENMPLVDYWTKKSAFHGAGHYLHSLYWQSMAPGGGGAPGNNLMNLINRDFGSFDKFKAQFTSIAKSVQGSGWAFLAMRPADKRLLVFQIENHEKLFPQNVVPLLTIDVWEHAYYLKYQNKRADYVTSWWNVVNWANAEKMLDPHK